VSSLVAVAGAVVLFGRRETIVRPTPSAAEGTAR
jgi:hypothetical protein